MHFQLPLTPQQVLRGGPDLRLYEPTRELVIGLHNDAYKINENFFYQYRVKVYTVAAMWDFHKTGNFDFAISPGGRLVRYHLLHERNSQPICELIGSTEGKDPNKFYVACRYPAKIWLGAYEAIVDGSGIEGINVS